MDPRLLSRTHTDDLRAAAKALLLVGANIENRGRIQCGICGELADLNFAHRKAMPYPAYRIALNIVRRYLGARGWAYPLGRQPYARAMACYWMALDLFDEADRLDATDPTLHPDRR